jgi:hypothetical protein
MFIIGLHKKPQDCGVFAASAAGPFTTKKIDLFLRIMDDVKSRTRR